MSKEKIIQIANLPDGWDYGTGHAPSKLVIDKALLFNDFIQLHDFDVEPIPSGDDEILLVISKEGSQIFIDLLIKKDLTLELRVESGIGNDYTVLEEQDNITLRDLLLSFKKYYDS